MSHPLRVMRDYDNKYLKEYTRQFNIINTDDIYTLYIQIDKINHKKYAFFFVRYKSRFGR